MTVETVCCGICGEKVPLDQDHVRVEAKIRRTRDPDDRDDYVVHPRCWRALSNGWRDPA